VHEVVEGEDVQETGEDGDQLAPFFQFDQIAITDREAGSPTRFD
jgi:hypothetical protein